MMKIVSIVSVRLVVDFFKREAQRHGTKYQQMIRRLLDAYTRTQERRISDH